MSRKRILYDTMEALILDVRALIKRTDLEHHSVCKIIADKYRLWNDNTQFPIWLSRIVEGEILDSKE